ncbi:hypothetical protein PR202_gb21038 [Eleusine coracana subsp. coracana]|uniref:Uncharacterized protein n=1 Tax=Eleusine coracana subsp. coracana TaxID=191504 RepID=A0AAV5FCI3_ELECO|nr:hypothetical protein PR202_gb21038 [Eleusine coracana subsp. coracana]
MSGPSPLPDLAAIGSCPALHATPPVVSPPCGLASAASILSALRRACPAPALRSTRPRSAGSPSCGLRPRKHRRHLDPFGHSFLFLPLLDNSSPIASPDSPTAAAVLPITAGHDWPCCCCRSKATLPGPVPTAVASSVESLHP